MVWNSRTQRAMDETDINQNFTNSKNAQNMKFLSVLSEHEALRKATLLKHRKVSTQLKLDMVQRQLSHLRREVTDKKDSDRQFYRSQMAELSSELQNLDTSLNKAERSALYSRRRMLRDCNLDPVSSSTGAIDNLSASNPTLFASTENLSSRTSLKERVYHMVSSPSARFKRKHLFGELRAAASLSSLNVKSSSPTTSCDDDFPPAKQPWRTPLRFLGNLVDNRIRRKFWSPTKKTKSSDSVPRQERSSVDLQESVEFSFVSESSSSSDEGSEDVGTPELRSCPEPVTWKGVPKRAWKAPVARRISNNQKAQVDPALMAEIEDFEKMVSTYLKHHS